MATPVVMPRQGNTVEDCIIVEWKKQPGDQIAEGDVLCEIETDKAVMEVESPVSGTLLALFHDEGDLVPVLETIAAIGEPGEDVSALRPGGAAGSEVQAAAESVPEAETEAETEAEAEAASPAQTLGAAPESLMSGDGAQAVSPRARNLAASKAVDLSGISGSGPGGRIIERDIEAVIAAQPVLSPVAKAMVESGEYRAPAQGTGPGGRIMAGDLIPVVEPEPAAPPAEAVRPAPAPVAAPAETVTVIPVRGVRRVIADRMRESLLSTAQLTMHRSVDARPLLAYRRRLKASDEALGLQGITINDLILYVTARTLARFPNVNALFLDDEAHPGGEIHQYAEVHLAFAVDTPRGLIVPVIRNAHRLTLRELAAESRRLANACLEGTVKPDELTGGTFTVTNLGALGVESFTPILNPPQVGILGVGGVVQKPTPTENGGYELAPHITLSLTINHQVVDGAPGARFLAALAQGVAEFELLLAG